MTATAETYTQLTIRRLGERDADAVIRLAELDSGAVPSAPLLGVEVEGRLLAAVSLRDGASIADPFSRTAEVRALLEARAAQLREDHSPIPHPGEAAVREDRGLDRPPSLGPSAARVAPS